MRPAPGGVVIAGGAGTRMGRPKAGVRLGGRALVDGAVDLLRARCADVVVVTRPGVPPPSPPARAVTDRPGPACVLAAIATGLDAIRADRAVVLACDLPFAAALVDDLLAVRGDPAAVVARDAHGVQPLCAVYARGAALRAAGRLLATGERRARALPAALRAVEVLDRRDALVNLNTPEELVAARARLRAARSPRR